jgi:CheY-like chemotaxis protein
MSVILIVEDDEQVRVLAESVLRDAGYGVLAAAALEGAQALLNSNQLIDLLFVDVNLGGDLEAGLRIAQNARCLHDGPRSGRRQKGAVCRALPLSSETIYVRAAHQFHCISS